MPVASYACNKFELLYARRDKIALMDVNKKIRLASVFGICFLVITVIKQLLTPGLHQLQPASYAAFYAYFFAFAILMIFFFGTYLLSFGGYLLLARKYRIRGLTTGALILMGATAILCVAILVSSLQMDLQGDATIANDIAALALGFYMIDPFVIGLLTMRLKGDLGGIAYGPVTVGAAIALYGIYSYGLPMLGSQPIAFLGNFVFIPIPEAAYVIASILLFRKAARGEEGRAVNKPRAILNV